MRTSDDDRFLTAFASFLHDVGRDAVELAEVVAAGRQGPSLRFAAAALAYVLRSVDVIPDGIGDLGFLDDAFVVRIACGIAAREDGEDAPTTVLRLAQDVPVVRDFLGEDYELLESVVRSLPTKDVRGISIDTIVADPKARAAFADQVTLWATQYSAPTFTRDTRTLTKLRSFLGGRFG